MKPSRVRVVSDLLCVVLQPKTSQPLAAKFLVVDHKPLVWNDPIVDGILCSLSRYLSEKTNSVVEASVVSCYFIAFSCRNVQDR